MRFINPGRGLLAAVALAGLLATTPALAQYPQQPAAYPQHTPAAYAQPAPPILGATATQPAQQTFAQAATQPTQRYAPAIQPGYPQAASPSYQQPTLGQQQAFPQLAQRTNAQPAPPHQAYNPLQPPHKAAPATVYSQYAPAQGYNPARPAAEPAYMAAAPAAGAAPTYPQASASGGAAPYNPPRMAMNFHPHAPSIENLSLGAPPEKIAPGQPQDDAGNGAYSQLPIAGEQHSAPAMPGSAGTAVDADHQPGGDGSYPGYGYNGAAYGSCDVYSSYGSDQPGMMSRALGRHGSGYWFGGVYGLVMDRDSGNTYPLAAAAGGLVDGDYPASSDVVLSTRDAESDFQGGVEFRLGRTFGGYADPSGCNYGPKWGVESVYWELFENNEYAQSVDNGSVRTFSMLPVEGLMFDPGSGILPVSEVWDYGSPVAASTVVVTMAKARSSFEARNVELNLLRLSMCGDACAGPAMCSVDCDGASCATGQCSADDGANGYERVLGRGGLGSRFSCTGVCGVRYLEFDESFMYGVNYFDTTAAAEGFLDYWANTENRLVGFQLGCNGMYRIGCKWGLHMNTLVGLYGNDIDVRQYFVNSAGTAVTFANGGTFDASASKTDVAMLGEMRLGASYQATARCRVYGGWRAIGVSGIALAGNQTPAAFLDAAQMSDFVNSNGSMILHGLQTGVEWNY